MTQHTPRIELPPDELAHKLNMAYEEAALVKRALDSHDDLLAALKEIMPWIGKALADDAFAWCVNPSRAHKAADHGCAAIAKAEKKS